MPSALGYRTYVNEIMRRHKLSAGDTYEINSALNQHPSQQSLLLSQAGKLASRLTTYPAYALTSATGLVSIARFDFIYIDPFSFIIVVLLSNDTVKNKLVHLMTPIDAKMLTRLMAVFNASFTGMPEERITPALIQSTERAVVDTSGIVAVIAGFTIELLCEAKTIGTSVSGAMNLLSHPEYRDIDKVQRLISYLSDDKELTRLPSPDSAGEIKITIGPENLAEELSDSSVIAARYDAGDDMQGLIGIVGPTRMDYSKVAARLSYIAQGLSLLISGGEYRVPAHSRVAAQSDELNEELGVEDIGEDN
jgi:heat-inducible transcriptional repressor